jgi:glycosyltransferase involved in cell wall biosynthesis
LEEGEEGMRIAHVVHSFYPVVGGIERAVFEVANRLSRRHRVSVLTSGSKPEGLLPFRVIRVPSVRLGFPDLTLPLRGSEELREADVVHFHSQNSLFSFSLLRRARNSVFTLMAVDSLRDHPNRFIRALSPPYSLLTTRRAVRSARRLAVKNSRDLELVRRKFGVSPILIPDGVDESYLSQGRSDQWSSKVDGKYIVYVGRLHRLKGVEVLMEASKWVRAKVVFVGPGDADHYRRLAERMGLKNRVIFTGFLDEREKRTVIDGSELVVIPSLSHYVEAFSITLSEAWSRGKAVVASNVGSLSTRIRSGVNGVLVNPGDPLALSRAINELLQNQEARERMGEKGREEVVTWDEVVSMLEGVYEEVAST